MDRKAVNSPHLQTKTTPNTSSNHQNPEPLHYSTCHNPQSAQKNTSHQSQSPLSFKEYNQQTVILSSQSPKCESFIQSKPQNNKSEFEQIDFLQNLTHQCQHGCLSSKQFSQIQKPINQPNPNLSLLSSRLQQVVQKSNEQLSQNSNQLTSFKTKKLTPVQISFLSWTKEFLAQIGMKNTASTLITQSQSKTDVLLGQLQPQINQIEGINQPTNINPMTEPISEQNFLKVISELQNTEDLFSFCETVVQSHQTNFSKNQKTSFPVDQLQNKTIKQKCQQRLQRQKNLISDMFCHYFSSSTKITLPIHQTLFYQHSNTINHISCLQNTSRHLNSFQKGQKNSDYQQEEISDMSKEDLAQQNLTQQFIISDKMSYLYHTNAKGETLRKDKDSMQGISYNRQKVIAMKGLLQGKYFATVLQKGILKLFQTISQSSFNQPSFKNQRQLSRYLRVQRQSFRRGLRMPRQERMRQKQKKEKFNYVQVISLLVANQQNAISSSKEYSITCAQLTVLDLPFVGGTQLNSAYLQVIYQLSPKEKCKIGGAIVIKVIKLTQVSVKQQKQQIQQNHREFQYNQRNWFNSNLSDKHNQKHIKLIAESLHQTIIPNPHQILYQNLHLYQFRHSSRISNNFSHSHIFNSNKPQTAISESDQQSNDSQTQRFERQPPKQQKRKKNPSPIQKDYRSQKIYNKQNKKLHKYLKAKSQLFSSDWLQKKNQNPIMQEYIDNFLTKFNQISHRPLNKRKQIDLLDQFILINFKVIGHAKSQEGDKNNKIKRISLIEFNGNAGGVFICKENEYINLYKFVKEQKTQEFSNLDEQPALNANISDKQYIYLFITGYEGKRISKVQKRRKENIVAYRKIIKINYMGSVIEEFPIFEYQTHVEQEEQLMVDLTIEMGGFNEFEDKIKSKQTNKKAKSYQPNKNYKKVSLNHLQEDSPEQQNNVNNSPNKLNSNKVSDFVIYPKCNLIAISTSSSIIYYSTTYKKILLSVGVDQSITDHPISKLVKIDQSLTKIGYVRGQFLQILDINKSEMVKKYKQKKSLKSLLGLMTRGFPRSYFTLLRQLALQNPDILNLGIF